MRIYRIAREVMGKGPMEEFVDDTVADQDRCANATIAETLTSLVVQPDRIELRCNPNL